MSDPTDFENLSSRLAAIDFSADSRIRAPLRFALLHKRRAADTAPRFFLVPATPLALALAACALLLLLPLRTQIQRVNQTADGAPVRLPKDAFGFPILPEKLIAQVSSDEPPLIVTRRIDRVFDQHAGRVIPGQNGSAILWEFDGASYILETRRFLPE